MERHAHTQTLIDYWEARRFGRPAPGGAEVAPRDLSGILANLFLLKRLDREHHVFRLAGSAMCELHQREFADQNFLGLWTGADRAHMSALLDGVLTAPAPATAISEAISLDGRRLTIEFAMVPLIGPEGLLDRVLGLQQPLEDAAALGGRPVVRHALLELRPARPAEPSQDVLRSFSGSVHRRAANDL
jgi:hypothetical protein